MYTICYLVILQDLLEYKKKQRVLRVRMLDGSVKTLYVDDSRTVSQLMIAICSKIGQTKFFLGFLESFIMSWKSQYEKWLKKKSLTW